MHVIFGIISPSFLRFAYQLYSAEVAEDDPDSRVESNLCAWNGLERFKPIAVAAPSNPVPAFENTWAALQW